MLAFPWVMVGLLVSVVELVLGKECLVALVVHDEVELLLEHVSGELLRVGPFPLVVEGFDLERVIVLDAWQRCEAIRTVAVIEVMSQLKRAVLTFVVMVVHASSHDVQISQLERCVTL